MGRWLIVLVLVAAALASRLAVARYLRNYNDGDSQVYAQIAENILTRHVYSRDVQAPFAPTLTRLPGYPLFLAGVYSVAGIGNNSAVLFVQAFIDTLTCVLVAVIASKWCPRERWKFRAGLAAFI